MDDEDQKFEDEKDRELDIPLSGELLEGEDHSLLADDDERMNEDEDDEDPLNNGFTAVEPEEDY